MSIVFARKAAAVIVSFSNRTAFTTAAGSVTTQNFNSFPPATGAFLGTPYDFGDFSALNDPHPQNIGDIVNPGIVNGSTALFGVATLAGAKFSFLFDYPITALGFDAWQIADQRTDRFSFNNATNDSINFSDPHDSNRFFGFISNTPFTTFTIEVVNANTDGFHIDDVTHSTAAIPEVNSFLLVGVFGLVAWGFAQLKMRTRRK
jgi:hypothetical protein